MEWHVYFILAILVKFLPRVYAAEVLQNEVMQLESDPKPGSVSFAVEKPFKILEGESREIFFVTTLPDAYSAGISFGHEGYATFSNFRYELVRNSLHVPPYEHLNETNKDSVTAFGTLNATGLFIGYETLTISIFDAKKQTIGDGSMKVSILLGNQFWSQVYSIGLSISLVVMYLNMGASLDISVLKQIVKKPIGPAIGLLCQYVGMPMIAYLLGLWAFPDNNLLRLGLFASGSSPGGGLSNMWTHLLGGSLDLSIMMTFVSTLAALGMVPFWLLVVGQGIVGGEYEIPFVNVLVTIIILVVPVFAGLFIQVRFPKATPYMHRLVTPISILNIIFILTVGVYANVYMFSFMSLKIVMVAFGQSMCGYIAGILLSMLFKRSFKETIAISIETAVQNNAVAHLFLRNSIELPAGDISAVIPGTVFLLTPPPLIAILLIKIAYQRFFKKSTGEFTQDPQRKNPKDADQGQAPSKNSQDDQQGYSNFAYTKES